MAKQSLHLTKAGKLVVGGVIVSLGLGFGAAGSVMLGYPPLPFWSVMFPQTAQTRSAPSLSAPVSLASSPENVSLEEESLFDLVHVADELLFDELLTYLVSSDADDSDIDVGAVDLRDAGVGGGGSGETAAQIPAASVMSAEDSVAGDRATAGHTAGHMSPAGVMVEVPPDMVRLLEAMQVPSLARDQPALPQVYRGQDTAAGGEVFSPQRVAPAAGKAAPVITSTVAEEDRAKSKMTDKTAKNAPQSANGVTVVYGRGSSGGADSKNEVSHEGGVTVYRGIAP